MSNKYLNYDIIYDFNAQNQDPGLLNRFNDLQNNINPILKPVYITSETSVQMLHFRKSDYGSASQMGLDLAKKSVKLNDMPKEDLPYEKILPDGSFLFKQISKDLVESHISVNNLASKNLHRGNGVTISRQIQKNGEYIFMMTPTEGMISMMNYITNGHIRQYLSSSPNQSQKHYDIVETGITPFIGESLAHSTIDSCI